MNHYNLPFMPLKRIISIILCAALALILCSACGQAEVNSDRLSGRNDNDSGGGPTIDDYENVGADGIFQKNFGGLGLVNFHINEIKMSDSLAEAGIAEADYSKSGSDTYDHYLTVSITVENIDLTAVDEESAEEINSALINEFVLYIKDSAEEIPIAPVYFNLGGVQNSDVKRYFEYELPKAGETLDVVLAYGLSDRNISSLKKDGGALFLTNEIAREKMKIEGVV